MTVCGTLCTDEFITDDHGTQTISKSTKLEKLTKIKIELIELEDKKLENGQIVRLLEEEIRKLQVKLAVRPSYNAYILSRAAVTSYWVSSNPELYKTMCSSTYDTKVHQGESRSTDCDSVTNWSDLSENICRDDIMTIKAPGSKRKLKINQKKPEKSQSIRTPAQPTKPIPSQKQLQTTCLQRTACQSEGVQTSLKSAKGTDIVHHLLMKIKEQDVSELSTTRSTDSNATFSCSSVPNKCAVQVTHSRNVTGFFTDYSLYHCTLHSSPGQVLSNEKRYSDFVSLRESLVKSFSFLKNSLPEFPEKKVVGKLKGDFIKRRQLGLEEFLDSIYMKKHSTYEVNKHIEMWLISDN